MNNFNILVCAPRVIGLCMVTVIVGVLEGCQPHTPPPLSSSIPDLSPWPIPSPTLKDQVINEITEEGVMAHIEELAITIGTRPAGSPAEAQAVDYMASQFQRWGYHIEHQPFTTNLRSGVTVSSSNIIATRPGAEQWLVVGGHLDSVVDSSGAVDNASGIAAVLETARLLSKIDTHYTLVFIGFGSEEDGSPNGSEYYVESLDQQTEQIVAMLNIDAIGAGVSPYVHAGAKVQIYSPAQGNVSFTGGPSWVRDLSVKVASIMGHEMLTAPADYWNGYTGFWSDHYPFVLEDVPVAYFEAWDWHSEVDSPWWGQETAVGDISNTSADTLERVIPQQVEQITEVVAGTAIAIATHSPPKSSSQPFFKPKDD